MKVHPQGRLRKSRLVAVAGLCAVALSSCGVNPPGVAADVEGDRITDAQVDDFVAVLCALGGSPEEGGSPTKAARHGALQILLANELAEEVADVDGVERAAVAAQLERMQPTREAVPEELLDTFDEVAEEFTRAENAILELGRRSLRQQGQQGPIPDDAAYAEGERLRREYAKKADIDIDPRFGSMKEGVYTPGDGSLSVPVSELAVQAAAPEPPPELIGLLPASQKCA